MSSPLLKDTDRAAKHTTTAFCERRCFDLVWGAAGDWFQRTYKTRLNSTDPIFRELRDLNFGRACDRLREKSIAIQQDYKVCGLDASYGYPLFTRTTAAFG
jgi:hypothetical protein